MATHRENYKSDIRVAVTLTQGGVSVPQPEHDFVLVFMTDGSRKYRCGRQGETYTNCEVVDGKVECYLDNHKLQPGVLRVEYYDFIPDSDFADGNQLKVVPQALDIELVTDAGDGAVDIDAEVATDVVAAIARANAIAADLESKRDADYWRGATGADGAPGAAGADGADGVGIASVVQTTTSLVSEGENIVTVTLTNGNSYTFSVRNGAQGEGGGVEQEQADWNETDTSDPAYIKNKPSIPAAQIQSDWNQSENSKADFIKNKPTIPAAQVNADWNAESGVAQILNKPTIPDVSGKADKRTLVDNSSASGAVTIYPDKYHDLGTTDAVNVVYPTRAGTVAGYSIEVTGESSNISDFMTRFAVYDADAEDNTAVAALLAAQSANSGASATYSMSVEAWTAFFTVCSDIDMIGSETVPVADSANAMDVDVPHQVPDYSRTDEFLFTFVCDTEHCALLLPDGVEMGNGLVFEAAAGRKVQVSIMDGIALLAYIDPSNNE